MKSIFELRNLFILLLSFGLLACGGDGNDTMENTEDAVEDAANDFADVFRSDKEEMKAEIERAREEVNEEIEELEANIENASGKAKADMQEELDELKAWSNDLGQKMEGLGDVAKDGWKDFKSNLNNTLKEVDRELSDEE
jgi:ElaB/YqjD/DUF883 family membrane-anchored ribosome-binding protein